MPYASIKDINPSIRKHFKGNTSKMRQFMHVVNDCLRRGGSEGSCIRQAHGAVNKSERGG